MGAYRMLVDADLPVTILHEDRVAADGVPRHVESVLWPMPAVSDEPLAAALNAFVHRGGRLVAESGPGEYTPTGRRRTTVPGGTLLDLFGTREIESTSMPPQTVVFPGGELGFAWQRAALEPLDATVLARFADGEPAATVVERGAGSAVLLAGFASVAAERSTSPAAVAALRRLLEHEPGDDWEGSGAGLVTRHATSASGIPLVFRLNWRREDAAFRARTAARILSPSDDGVVESRVVAGDRVIVPALAGVLVVQE
jgi:beta-galactosidase